MRQPEAAAYIAEAFEEHEQALGSQLDAIQDQVAIYALIGLALVLFPGAREWLAGLAALGILMNLVLRRALGSWRRSGRAGRIRAEVVAERAQALEALAGMAK